MKPLYAKAKAFPHFGMTLERARAYAGTFLDQSVYIGAFLGDTMIGFIKADHGRRSKPSLFGAYPLDG